MCVNSHDFCVKPSRVLTTLKKCSICFQRKTFRSMVKCSGCNITCHTTCLAMFSKVFQVKKTIDDDDKRQDSNKNDTTMTGGHQKISNELLVIVVKDAKIGDEKGIGQTSAADKAGLVKTAVSTIIPFANDLEELKSSHQFTKTVINPEKVVKADDLSPSNPLEAYRYHIIQRPFKRIIPSHPIGALAQTTLTKFGSRHPFKDEFQ